MQLAGSSDRDLRTLPQLPPEKIFRPEREQPPVVPVPLPGTTGNNTSGTNTAALDTGTAGTTGTNQGANAPAPSALISFDGLDYTTWGGGHPPDTNGDVGPTYYIETVNTSIGIFQKSDGSQVAAFRFNTFMSQGHFGNLCDTNNFGDPVVLYDSFEDRWMISDFAFEFDNSGNIMNPPGSFQCIAVSKSGDPVSGGWNFYSINTTGGLGDYPKFGIWPDGIYMSANMFDYAASGSFQNVRLYAFNKAQMYAGQPSVQVVSFDMPGDQFSVLPSNARLQTGTPPAGSPNYYATVWNYLNSIGIWKFHVDWSHISASTLTGPFNVVTNSWWAEFGRTVSGQTVSTAPSPANNLDTLYPRLMMQNQYTNIGGVESIWNSQTVGAGNPTTQTTSTQSAVRYYQVKVTGGSVESTATQAYTYSPDSTLYRFMSSAAVNSVGDMAIGYSGSNSTKDPVINYAGRLSTDSTNSITQTEQTLIAGTGSQSGNCGSSSCERWGDYSAMTLDPDGCTFWYSQEYYKTTGLDDLTRIGAFRFPTCTNSQIATGTVHGTVKAGATAVAGAIVNLGATRSTVTDSNGNYSFTGIPAGTYAAMTASYPGFVTGSVSNITVSNGGTTVENFTLVSAPVNGCFTDTTETDFQAGIPTGCDLSSSAGNVILSGSSTIDKQNTSVTSSGFSFDNVNWAGQTFVPAVSGKLMRVDLALFCSGCTGTTSNITVSIRATSGSVPTGADLAVTTAGFSTSEGGYFSATFSSPPTLTAGTKYAIVFRAANSISAGTYAFFCSCSSNGSSGTNPYTAGQFVTSSNSGGAWSADTTAGGRDAGFRTYMGYATLGTFVSSLKDANPAAGETPAWTTLSWNASVPTNTSLKFQVAASNNATGPFNFVGPDGTASTYFMSASSLAMFTGNRYLKYQATLSTTDATKTPTLNDVTVCFSNGGGTATTLTVPAVSGTYSGTVNLSATLKAGTNGVSGKAISFTLNSAGVGSAVTNSSGVATLSSVSLGSTNAGTYTGGVGASFTGDSTYAASSGVGDLTVSKSSQAITFAPLPDKNFGDPDFTVSATSTSGLTVSFSATGQCTVSGSTVHLVKAGSCTITASQSGNSNYNAAASVSQSFNIASGTPLAISVTPNSGTGSTQTFSFVFSDGNGFAALPVTEVLFGANTNYGSSCVVYYNQTVNGLYLNNDQVTGFLGPITPGTVTTLQNSRCTLNAAASSASGSGTNLTLNLALTFAPTFTGLKNVYLYAQDTNGLNSGWAQKGTWTAYSGAAQPPSAVSVTPNSGSGPTQTFSFAFSDASGYSAIPITQVLFGASTSYSSSCVVYYNQPGNGLYLANDQANGWLGPITPGTSSTLQNSKCTVNGAGSSVSGSGTTLTLNLALTFQPLFVGAKNIFMYAEDTSGQNSGWQNKGTWTAFAGTVPPPAAVSVTPNSGTGPTQTFSFVFSDGNGYGALPITEMLFGVTTSYLSSCVVYYNQPADSIYLQNDQATGWLGPVKPGVAGTVTNSKCSLDGAGSSISGAGTSLTLNLAMTFQSSFTGTKNIYMYAEDSSGLNTGWQALGTWTAYAGTTPPPAAISVTPNSGSGATQTFAFTYSDAGGFASIAQTEVLFGASTSYLSSCVLDYIASSNSIYLMNDQATAWLGPVTPGESGTLQNSKCAIDASGSSVSGSGTTLTLNLAMTFQSTFTGTKNIYMYAEDSTGLNTGWQSMGTWTPFATTTQPPSAVSVTPNSGSGASQTFAFVYSDAGGFAAISTAEMLFGVDTTYSTSCVVDYSQSSNSLYLANDQANGWIGPISPGSGTLQNSKCTVNGSGSSVNGSGNNMTVNLALTFQATFTGIKNIFMYAEDPDGLNTGWQNRGTWTAFP